MLLDTTGRLFFKHCDVMRFSFSCLLSNRPFDFSLVHLVAQLTSAGRSSWKPSKPLVKHSMAVQVAISATVRKAMWHINKILLLKYSTACLVLPWIQWNSSFSLLSLSYVGSMPEHWWKVEKEWCRLGQGSNSLILGNTCGPHQSNMNRKMKAA